MRIEFRNAVLEWTPSGCRTTFSDGSFLNSVPHDTAHYHVIAHRCGYGDDILAYCRFHDFSHLFCCERILGKDTVLHDVARGIDPDNPALEESFVQMFQRWLHANEEPIISDVAWAERKREALLMLES